MKEENKKIESVTFKRLIIWIESKHKITNSSNKSDTQEGEYLKSYQENYRFSTTKQENIE